MQWAFWVSRQPISMNTACPGTRWKMRSPPQRGLPRRIGWKLRPMEYLDTRWRRKPGLNTAKSKRSQPNLPMCPFDIMRLPRRDSLPPRPEPPSLLHWRCRATLSSLPGCSLCLQRRMQARGSHARQQRIQLRITLRPIIGITKEHIRLGESVRTILLPCSANQAKRILSTSMH